MRSVNSVTMVTGTLAAALIVAALQPAVAGPACNELDLRSPCIKSNDIRPNIVLGGATGDARLRLRNEDRATGVDLQASTGNVTNLFSNDADQSNGLVKAWARINPDGTIAACWRCNTDPAATLRSDTGRYVVDFTPLATDVTGRPKSALVENAMGAIVFGDNAGDPSTVFVGTSDLDGNAADRSFFLIIF